MSQGKHARFIALSLVLIGAAVGYIAACSNTDPAKDATASAPAEVATNGGDKTPKTDATPTAEAPRTADATQTADTEPAANAAEQVDGAKDAVAQAPAAVAPAAVVGQNDKKPNILVIMGDDIGIPNVSVYSHGMMGYQTPNIDRIAKEGVMLTDYYAEQSCTAGRASFITGQYGIRTGLTKVGLPGAAVGIRAQDPTLAELLKPLGYRTGRSVTNPC